MAQALDERYFPLILDVLDQGVFTVDEHTRISSFNKIAEEITGYTAAEVIGQQCAKIFDTNLCSQVCPLRHSIRARTPVRDQEVSIRTKDGRTVPISVSTAPLLTRQGDLLGGVEVFRDLTQLDALRRQLDDRFRLEDIVGKSPAMLRLFERVKLVAQSEATALIRGASGTGKELVARTIHTLSARAKGPFVAVNCGAIPETLLESELFGHVRGAFTGASRDRKGRVAAAQGGTLFLDEVGDLPLPVQVKVLRFLQEHEYSPLGSDAPRRADVRVLAATHRDLDQLVAQGGFREDLFFRLNVVDVRVPTLSERPEDIPLLVEHYVAQLHARTGKPIEGVKQDALGCLIAYGFPGNVRELENIMERAFVLCQGDRIELEHLPECVRTCAVRDAGKRAAGAEDRPDEGAIRAVLARHGNNRSAAARELGVHRVTLHRWLRRLGID
ncbi:MAG: sigma 54-interacting transcriptional regulator [Myxococcales bacterium]|nr:sigma 54-interacting transcriptional regulator [Myxococcales bacterium]MCB9650079.1 sigma 54-interacting transcriptional regulator [Deltaproteobacteria bacterium]